MPASCKFTFRPQLVQVLLSKNLCSSRNRDQQASKKDHKNKRGGKKKKYRPSKVAFAAETLLKADPFEILLRKVAPVCVCVCVCVCVHGSCCEKSLLSSTAARITDKPFP